MKHRDWHYNYIIIWVIPKLVYLRAKCTLNTDTNRDSTSQLTQSQVSNKKNVYKKTKQKHGTCEFHLLVAAKNHPKMPFHSSNLVGFREDKLVVECFIFSAQNPIYSEAILINNFEFRSTPPFFFFFFGGGGRRGKRGEYPYWAVL